MIIDGYIYRDRSGDERNSENLRTRKFSVGEKGGGPTTLNEESRTVDIVIASETDQITIWDWEMDRDIPEVLIMSGCEIPESGQVPLLDSHGRWSVGDVLGSVRNIAIDGDTLVGVAHYSEDEKADSAFRKTREGHLTDYSAGFRYLKNGQMKLAEDQTTEIDGRTYEGPCLLVTKWTLKEVSTCPIGADPTAKARADQHQQVRDDNHGPQSKESNMNERLRKYLISRGLDPNATEDEAWKFFERIEKEDAGSGGQRASDQGATVDVDRVRNDERERILSIRMLCQKHGCDDLADGMITGNKTVDEARAAVLSHIETRDTETDQDTPGFRAEVVLDGRDKFRDAAQDAMHLRAGHTIEKPALGHDELMGRTLVETARLCLRYANQSDRGNPLEMVGRALTTSDFSIILSNTANMSLMDGYESAEESWPLFCAEGSVNDFKEHTAARASEAPDLDQIVENGEYKHGALSDGKESYTIATYGKLLAISRQAIINDDMGALTDIPVKMGEACSRKVGDAVFAVPTGNAAMGDGVALFHSNHSNLAGSGGLISAAFGVAVLAMKTQKDIGGKRRLNIRPQFVLAPCAIEETTEKFFTSEFFDSSNAGATRKNIYAGNQYRRIYESRLDDDSTTSWYVLGPKGKTIKVFFLYGNKKPYMESKQGWTRDGVEFKVRIDAVAKAMDWKAMYKNPGS